MRKVLILGGLGNGSVIANAITHATLDDNMLHQYYCIS